MKKHGRWPALMLAGAMMVSSVANVGLVPQAHAQGEYPNLALSKPATSKNDEGYGLVASNAVDGSCTGDNANSRWSSAMSSGETWLMVDLENYATIHSFQVVWVEPHANPYKIQFSADGTNWVDAYSDEDGVNVDEYTEHTKDVNGGQRFDPHTLTYTLDKPLEGMRYARMWANKQGGGYPCIGVYEFRVFGEEGEVVQELLNKDPANLALGKTAVPMPLPSPIGVRTSSPTASSTAPLPSLTSPDGPARQALPAGCRSTCVSPRSSRSSIWSGSSPWWRTTTLRFPITVPTGPRSTPQRRTRKGIRCPIGSLWTPL